MKRREGEREGERHGGVKEEGKVEGGGGGCRRRRMVLNVLSWWG